MRERHFLTTMNDVGLGNDESLMSYYDFLNKKLVGIDQVILEGDVLRYIMIGLGPKGIAMKDNHQVIPIYNPEELDERLNAYIDLERSKEQKTVLRRGLTK